MASSNTGGGGGGGGGGGATSSGGSSSVWEERCRLQGPYYNLKHCDPYPSSLDHNNDYHHQHQQQQQAPPPSFQPFSVVQQQQQYLPFRRRPRTFACVCAVSSVVLVLIALTVLLLYIIYHPRYPRISVRDFKVSELNISSAQLGSNFASGSDFAYLNSSFLVDLQSFNPNKRLGISYVYLDVRVIYRGEVLHTYAIPPFTQPKRNTTILSVELPSRSVSLPKEVSNNLQNDEASHSIGFLLVIIIEARLALGNSRSFPFWVYANCHEQVSPPSDTAGSRLLQNQCSAERS